MKSSHYAAAMRGSSRCSGWLWLFW